MIKNHIGKHVDDESLYDMSEKSSSSARTLVNIFTFAIIAIAAASLILAFVRPVIVQ